MGFRRRALVAVTEVLAAIVLAWLAWWCWNRGLIVTVSNGVALLRIEGRWWAAATGAATLAGILVLNALRQGVLTIAPRPAGRPSRPAGPEGHPPEVEPRYR
ncbi:MAG: hypothetical protein ACRDRY_13630 [Pseudonocardiaceae bacterium]